MPKLSKELQVELIEMLRTIERECEPQYLAVVRRCAKLRSLIKGDPADWYDNGSREWRAWSDHFTYNAEQDDEYNYNINFSQAWWQILQSAVQTQGIPGATFRPQNPQDMADREAAQTGSEIAEYQRTVVDFRDIIMGIYRLCYTDGTVLAYTRHVRDASKWGTSEVSEPIIEDQVTQEAGYQCFMCNEFTPSGLPLRDEAGMIYCPMCKSPLHAENFTEAQIGQVEVGKKTAVVPNGREITDLYGALESLLPWWANNLLQAPYAAIKTGMPKEEIIQAFPWLEDEIEGTSADLGRTGTMERENARAPQGASGLSTSQNFPTYYRVWFRPVMFYRIGDKEKRELLLKEFPNGIFFQLYGDVFLDTDEKRGCWDEKLEKRLTLIRPFKGDGMYTPSIGQSGVPIHEAAQEAWNMGLEAMEHAAFSTILIDGKLLSGKSMADNRLRAGVFKEVDCSGGAKLRDGFAELKSQDISASVQSFIAMAQPMAEFLLGTVNALQGQPITNVRTAGGQAQSRNQGLQRQAPVYGAVKEGMAGIVGQLVNEFLEYQNPETYYEITAESGDIRQRSIQLSPERGNVVAYPEASEGIPATWAQKQDAIRQAWESQNPFVMEIMRHPKNARTIYESLGLPELVAPGKIMADKYERIIQELLGTKPIMSQNPDEPPTIAIPFDSVLDDAPAALAIIMEWAATKEGMAAQSSKPEGFAAVRIFAEQAKQAIAASQPQEPPPPFDEQKQNLTELQEETKRAVAEISAQSRLAQEEMQSATDKWLANMEADKEIVMQQRQLAHDKVTASRESGERE